jgi:hypothetical protein
MSRHFFIAATVAIALVVLAGFSYSTYARLQLGDLRFGGPSLTPMVRIHAALSIAWIVLLVAQTRLVAANGIRLHRQMGTLGGLLAVVMVVLGWFVGVTATRRGARAVAPSEVPLVLGFFVLVVQELTVFTILTGLALWLRKKAAFHKRLMLIGTLALIPAATTRPLEPGSLPMALAMFGVPEAIFVGALCWHDWRTVGRVHRATAWGGGLLLVTAVSRTWVGTTEPWLAFAKAIVIG